MCAPLTDGEHGEGRMRGAGDRRREMDCDRRGLNGGSQECPHSAASGKGRRQAGVDTNGWRGRFRPRDSLLNWPQPRGRRQTCRHECLRRKDG